MMGALWRWLSSPPAVTTTSDRLHDAANRLRGVIERYERDQRIAARRKAARRARRGRNKGRYPFLASRGTR